MTFRKWAKRSINMVLFYLCSVLLSNLPALHVLRSYKMLLSQLWKKALILSALHKLQMNAKCDLKVLLYTYKVVHVFAQCCLSSLLAGQYLCPLCAWLFLLGFIVHGEWDIIFLSNSVIWMFSLYTWLYFDRAFLFVRPTFKFPALFFSYKTCLYYSRGGF